MFLFYLAACLFRRVGNVYYLLNGMWGEMDDGKNWKPMSLLRPTHLVLVLIPKAQTPAYF